MKKVTVEAPASSANLGPGFDVFALALASPNDMVTLRAERAAKPRVKIRQVYGPTVPLVAAKNSAGTVCLAMAKDRGVNASITMEITKGVPTGLGMGSSGASAAAAAVSMNLLFEMEMSSDDLIYYAGKGEKAVSGTAHYDNVSASVLGGFVVVCASGERPIATRLDAPEKMSLCMVTPSVKLPERKTEYARSLLPTSVGLETLVSNIANASLMVSGFARRDIGMIGRGMDGRFVEEARKTMIPGYDSVKESALEAGASGVCISGAGPSVLAVVDRSKANPPGVLNAMVTRFRQSGMNANGFVTRVGEGAREVASR